MTPPQDAVAVVGTFNVDLLLQASSSGRSLERREAGGLAYSVKALGALRPSWTLKPVAYMGEDHASLFHSLLNAHGARLDGLFPWPGPGNEVCLDCRVEEKPERAMLRCPPLDAVRLESLLDCSRVLLNCTSGRDVEPEAWAAVKRAWRGRHPRGWLQMDWHSLSLDWEAGRPRRLRRVPDAFRWLEDLDLVQLTLQECGSLVGRAPKRLEEAVDLALRMRGAGCRRVVVSDGSRGFLFVDAQGPRRQAAWPVDGVEDTTGCGDVLGASLLATLGAGWPVEEALPLAALHAAQVCAGTGLASLDVLKALPERNEGLPGEGMRALS